MYTQTAVSFLSELFKTVPNSKIYITQLPYGNDKYVDARTPSISGDLTTGQWFFGATPRDNNGNPIGVSHVWTDLDHVLVPPDVLFIAPPSAMVYSGHGIHLYFLLTELVSVEVGIRLTKLSTLAFGGDTSVCEPQRIMRLPGSFNKKDANNPVEVRFLPNGWQAYTPQELEERLVAAVIAPLWESGHRHQLALSTAALLSRANWDIARAVSVIDHICDFKQDIDRDDRYIAVQTTFNRRFSGDLVSSSLLRDLLDKGFKVLLDCLGVFSRDGELIYQEEVFGRTVTLERDLTRLTIDKVKDWSWADGVLVKWVTNRWQHYDEDVLRREVFGLFSDIKVISGGEELEFSPSVKQSGAVMSIFKGFCKTTELSTPREDIIPLENGVLEVPGFAFRKHQPSDYNRYFMPVVYDDSASCPRWIDFITEAAGEDVEVITFLQEWFGYCFTLGNPWQRMVWIQGRTGTGKSTFQKIFFALFGSSAAPIVPNDIDAQAVASICHAHIAVCSEITRRKLQTRRINELVTGDVIKARFLYGKQFDARFRGKLVWSSNSFPPVDEGEGLFRRIVAIPFNTKPKKPDNFLEEKLIKELPGIFNWGIEGRKRLEGHNERGEWPIPSVAIKLLENYRESAEVMQLFFEDCLLPDQNSIISSEQLYVVYKTWCETYGHKPLAFDATFFNEMTRLGLTRLEKPYRFGRTLKKGWRGAKFLEVEIEGLGNIGE